MGRPKGSKNKNSAAATRAPRAATRKTAPAATRAPRSASAGNDSLVASVAVQMASVATQFVAFSERLARLESILGGHGNAIDSIAHTANQVNTTFNERLTRVEGAINNLIVRLNQQAVEAKEAASNGAADLEKNTSPLFSEGAAQ